MGAEAEQSSNHTVQAREDSLCGAAEDCLDPERSSSQVGRNADPRQELPTETAADLDHPWSRWLQCGRGI